jgi:hypothetical protein
MIYPSSFLKGDSDWVSVTIFVPKPMRDALKHKAINESGTMQTVGYTALRAAALDVPPPLPSARVVEAIGNYREEIQAAYPIGSEMRGKLLALARQMTDLVAADHKADTI